MVQSKSRNTTKLMFTDSLHPNWLSLSYSVKDEGYKCLSLHASTAGQDMLLRPVAVDD